tara:strand:- start:439 stop:735 length:297 start_codon:yes stop_codon:yes gene_type:complete
MSEKAWHISYLSAIVGPCSATTDDGCMAWSDDESGFLMRLLDRDNKGIDLMLIIQPEMPEITIYTLSGYCVANNLKYLIKDWDSLSEEGQKEAQKTRH